MSRILPKIKDPRDLKMLNLDTKEKLAQEIRDYIVDIVADTGGHLASNLGVVELTLAVHSVFDSPIDKVVWDVGHQSYVHKIITGRYESFSTLRQYGGLSGFPKREESIHDIYETGHSSTSISAALGLAVARDLKDEKHNVVSVIGDGSMTGGLSYEALNNAGHDQRKIIVILNDNNMSISKNVGAMSSYLSRIRAAPTYSRFKNDIEYIIKRIPAFGTKMLNTVERVKDSLKYLVVAGVIFEEMGFTYLGPINGHDISKMEKIMESAKKIDGPVLIHALTEKGKGYSPAEKNPEVFHGTGPFIKNNGVSKKKRKSLTFTQVFSETITKIASNDSSIVGITAAMPDGTGLEKMREIFPKRCFDVGIAESHAVTFASGLATAGMKPVVAIYSTFLQRAFDQIAVDVCLQNLPVVFAVDRAGIVGEDGETHQGAFDLSYLRSLPNMTVMAPKDENELQHMLYTAVNLNGPCAIRYPRGEGFGTAMDQNFHQIPCGSAELLRKGSDIVLIATGPSVYWCLEAADEMRKEGIQASVVNSRFIKPLDKELILSQLDECGLGIVIEENVRAGGLASGVAELYLNGKENNAKIYSLALPDRFVPHGSRKELLELNSLSQEGIQEIMKMLLNERESNAQTAKLHRIR